MGRQKGSFGSITLTDVAKAAGVATMTVSRFLNNHPNVTEKTARKVKTAIDKLGYSPNHAARMLMGQPSKVIGLIVPDLTDAFFATVAHFVQEVAQSRGYLVWIAATNGKSSADVEILQQMRQHHVDGILLIPSPPTTLLDVDLQELPLIALDRPLPGTRIDAVTLENRHDARAAVLHLIGHGYKRIACIGPEPDLYTIRERFIGYGDAMRENKLALMPYAQCDDTLSAIKAIRRFRSAKAPLQALFTLNSVATIRALGALHEMNISVPGDIALFGFDDVALADVLRPRLSVLKQPADQLGERAASLLLDLINRRGSPSGMTVTIPASLVIRESCGCKVERVSVATI